MRWAQITLSADPALVDPVSAVLIEVGCAGVVIEDPSAVTADPFADYAAALEPAHSPIRLTDEASVCAVSGYLPVDDRLEPALDDLSRRLAILQEAGVPVDPEITLRTVEDSGWAEAWKAYFKPIRVGRHFVVKPSWETWDAQPGDRVIELDPGMAFGSGTHPTTRVCLQLLEVIVLPGDRVLDWGTGSGILSVGAALLGAKEIVAVDLDPTAVSVTQENARLNGITERLVTYAASIEDVPRQPPFDLVIANIVADPIIAGAAEIRAHLREGGHALLSGIIDRREAEVLAAVKDAGLTVLRIEHEEEGWRALVVRRDD